MQASFAPIFLMIQIGLSFGSPQYYDYDRDQLQTHHERQQWLNDPYNNNDSMNYPQRQECNNDEMMEQMNGFLENLAENQNQFLQEIDEMIGAKLSRMLQELVRGQQQPVRNGNWGRPEQPGNQGNFGPRSSPGSNGGWGQQQFRNQDQGGWGQQQPGGLRSNGGSQSQEQGGNWGRLGNQGSSSQQPENPISNGGWGQQQPRSQGGNWGQLGNQGGSFQQPENVAQEQPTE